MFCPKCGNKVSDDASFCGNCGERFYIQQTIGINSPEIQATSSSQSGIEVQPTRFAYATGTDRIFAWVIDVLIILALSRGVSFLIPWINPFSLFDFFSSSLSFLFDFLFGFFYFWLMESYNKGQTLGKMALSIKTVDENTLEVSTPINYALNNLSKSTAFIILDVILGVLVNSGDPQKRLRILQNVSKTVVVKVPK